MLYEPIIQGAFSQAAKYGFWSGLTGFALDVLVQADEGGKMKLTFTKVSFIAGAFFGALQIYFGPHIALGIIAGMAIEFIRENEDSKFQNLHCPKIQQLVAAGFLGGVSVYLGFLFEQAVPVRIV